MNCYIDRELSWLEFNYRVLMEADDSNIPLLERLQFLEIYYRNLDEFFMVRVGSLIHRRILMPEYKDPKTGWNTATQLKKIQKAVALQQKQAEKVYIKLNADLKAEGVEIVDFSTVSKLDESIARKVYAEIDEFLSPRFIDAKHPMQFLGSGESYMLNLVQKDTKKLTGIVSLYRIPKYRVYENNGVKKVFIMSELVRHFAGKIYGKHCSVKESCIIRVTRNADVFADGEAENYSEDFRLQMEKLLKKRKHQQPVRLQIQGGISPSFRQTIVKNIGVDEKRVYEGLVPFDLGFRKELGPMFRLSYEPRATVRGINLKRGEILKYLDEKDILLSFPYHSMDAFVDMLYEAADTKDVESIKITLYRLSSSSKVAMALAYAADKGKDVLCLLELRARFDEQNNIDYSEMLSGAGCRVIYGLPDMKVHSKLCLITRRRGKKVSHITQVGTGNYNEKTSEIYCDLSVMTSDETAALDAGIVFDALEKGEPAPRTECLMAAPNGFKPRLLEMLEEEKKKGKRGYVSIKVNSINDIDVMSKLVECSCAGVPVELFVRGICSLQPGIPGLTENITVKSIVGRYLEHSRIFVLGRGKSRRIFIGSGDLLNRNTNRRVETFLEIKRPEIEKQVLKVLSAFREDEANGWILEEKGKYRKLQGDPATSSHDRLYKYFR